MTLLRSTAVVSGMTSVSRVLGFIRDVVIAGMIGASGGADAFFVAFRIPNFLRRLFAEGAFSQAFVPVLSEYRTQRDQQAVRDLVDRSAGTLALVLFGVSLLAVIAAPLLVLIFAPGFHHTPARFDLTVELLRITFPYLLFISLTALAGGVLNSYGRFAVPALTPVFLNLSLIAAAIWLAPMMSRPTLALAWGVFFGGLVQLGFQLPFLLRIGLLPRPRFDLADAGVRRILKLMGPAIFGVSVSQVNLLLDTLIASFLVTGSVSWLYYSDRLVEFPLGVFSIALATVILPGLSREHARGSVEEFSHMLDWALRWVVVIATPAALALVLLAGPILTTLFQYGAFQAHDVEMASRSLMAYALGLLGFSFIKVLAPGFYARQDTRTPVRIGVIAMITNMVLNLLLVLPLAHAGLALATSLSAFVNAGLLLRILRRKDIYRPLPGWGALLLRVGMAVLVMCLVLYWGSAGLQEWLARDALSRAVWLGLWIGAGTGTYLLCLPLFGLRPRHMRAQATQV